MIKFIKVVTILKLIQMAQKINVIVKPTHDCNLKCKYCYLEENIEQGHMNERLLSQSIEKVSNYYN